MQTHQITTYQLAEHPDKESVLDWIRSNWHDLGDDVAQEAIDSLKGFCDHFDLSLDYSISIVPDRGEHITAKMQNDDVAELSCVRLYKYIVNNYPGVLSGDCPFTGVCYDENLLAI